MEGLDTSAYFKKCYLQGLNWVLDRKLSFFSMLRYLTVPVKYLNIVVSWIQTRFRRRLLPLSREFCFMGVWTFPPPSDPNFLVPVLVEIVWPIQCIEATCNTSCMQGWKTEARKLEVLPSQAQEDQWRVECGYSFRHMSLQKHNTYSHQAPITEFLGLPSTMGMKGDNDAISNLEESPMDTWPVSGNIHTYSLFQPEFLERIRLESPGVRPNLRHLVQVTNLGKLRKYIFNHFLWPMGQMRNLGSKSQQGFCYFLFCFKTCT